MKIKEKMPTAIADSQFIIGLPYETPKTANVWLAEISQKDYPLNNVKVHTLSMNATSGYETIWSSDFERNPEKYGYTFPMPDNKTYWVNNMNFSRKQAFEVLAKHQNALDRKTDEGWLGYAGLRNLGVSDEDLKVLYSQHKLHRIQNVNSVRREFTAQYIQDLLKLNPQ